MAVIKQVDTQELLARGARRARSLNRAVVVSQVTRVGPIDPLTFWNRGEACFAGERSFWSDPGREIVLVGLGTATSIETDGNGRFAEVEKRWTRLLEESIIEPGSPERGTGPLLMGGFSFDPKNGKTPLWEPFADASLVLPRYLLTVSGERAWLTVNRWIRPGDDPDDLFREWIRERDRILKGEGDPDPLPEPGAFQLEEVAPEDWKKAVALAAIQIRNRLLEKVVLSRELRVRGDRDFSPVRVMKRLRDEQSHSFLFAVERGQSCFVGASPERLVKREGNRLISTCLAGSIRRGSTPREDERLGRELLQDEKNREEHAVVVRMIRDRFMEGCTQVTAPEEPALYKVRDIQHLFTPVIGHIRTGTTLLSMVERLHPTPALGGFPQQDALAKIREIEGMDRGWYAGPVGWLDFRGDGEFAVAIRSGLLTGNRASLFAGCGIVGASNPESEYEETKMKFRPMLSALGVKR